MSRNIEMTIEEHIEYLASVQKMNEITKIAHQELQKKNSFSGNFADGNEVEIRGQCSQVDVLLTNRFNKSISDKLGELDNLSNKIVSDVGSSLVGIGFDAAKAEVQALAAGMATQLRNAKEKVTLAKQSLELFKGANGISWDPSFPDSSKAVIISICIAMGIEGIANIIFLTQGANTLNAIAIAIFAAILNVGVSAYLGTIYRWKNHHDADKRTKGYAALFAALAFMVALNVFIAVVRVKIAGETDSNLLTTIFYVESFLLCCVGVGLGFYAFTKGYKLDDIYPEFGHVYRNWLIAQEEFEELENEFRVNAALIPEKMDKKIISMRDSINFSDVESQRILSEINTDLRSWETLRANLENAFKALVSSYRGIAKAFLGQMGRDVPSYFNLEPSIGESALLESAKKKHKEHIDLKLAREEAKLNNFSKLDKAREDLMSWRANQMQSLVESYL